MKKEELMSRVAEETGLTKKDVTAAYDKTFELIFEELNTDTECAVSVPNLGTIKVGLVAEHEGKNPATGEKMIIPEKRQARMSLSKRVKDALVQPSDKKKSSKKEAKSAKAPVKAVAGKKKIVKKK
jgi:DNA-binding protein HU-beta